jgi:medium-chain acyl-[acyl-carrier-protein] hydrolase
MYGSREHGVISGMDEVKLRVFCLPYAGGSASVFRQWQRLVPQTCEIHPIPLPGRGAQLGQPAIGDYGALVQWVADYVELQASASSRAGCSFHYALFGYSAGARFSFGAAARLAAKDLAPRRCFFAASGPPHIGVRLPGLWQRNAQDLIAQIRVMGGTPPEVLADAVLMELALPALRADLRATEESVSDRDVKVNVPLTLIAADRDRQLSPDDVWAWERYTTGRCRRVMLHGDHFSPLREPSQLLAELQQDIHNMLASKMEPDDERP